ncbi:MAG: hypothetical protein IH861_01470, partial [Chloroflexi bacterium]|nr:hypothetical protein [Chloroflexota bacterium]
MLARIVRSYLFASGMGREGIRLPAQCLAVIMTFLGVLCYSFLSPAVEVRTTRERR